jgi:hypothetical protein
LLKVGISAFFRVCSLAWAGKTWFPNRNPSGKNNLQPARLPWLLLEESRKLDLEAFF